MNKKPLSQTEDHLHQKLTDLFQINDSILEFIEKNYTLRADKDVGKKQEQSIMMTMPPHVLNTKIVAVYRKRVAEDALNQLLSKKQKARKTNKEEHVRQKALLAIERYVLQATDYCISSSSLNSLVNQGKVEFEKLRSKM